VIAMMVLGSCERSEDELAQQRVERDGAVTFKLEGVVKDEAGEPMAGARVSVDGVESSAQTDAGGRYEIMSPYPFSNEVRVTVKKPGFRGVSRALKAAPGDDGDKKNTKVTICHLPSGDEDKTVTLEVADDAVLQGHLDHGDTLGACGSDLEVEDVEVSERVTIDALDFEDLVDGAAVDISSGCSVSLPVSGFVALESKPNRFFEIVLLLDASGSIERDDSFAASIAAAKALIAKLESKHTKIGIIRFATNATVVQHPTNSFDLVLRRLDEQAEQGPEAYKTQEGATNYEAALLGALDVLKPAERGANDNYRLVLMFSDGKPTLPIAPGLTQEPGDLEASLAAAELLAEAGIVVHTYSVGVREEDLRLTTLASIADLTGGEYVVVADSADLTQTLGTASLVGIGAATVANSKEAPTSTPLTLGLDGSFTASITVYPGAQTITLTAEDMSGVVTTSKTYTLTGVLPDGATCAD